MRRLIQYILVLVSAGMLGRVAAVQSQEPDHPDTEPWSSRVPWSQLDPSVFDSAAGPDIGMFTGNWREAMPVLQTGAFAERAVLTRSSGDPLHPGRTGAVLTRLSRLSHIALRPGMVTPDLRSTDEQTILYVLGGTGTITGGGETYPLREGVYAFIPSGMTWSMTAATDEPLTLYLAAEPLPEGFRPVEHMICRDVVSVGPRAEPERWHNRIISLLSPGDGLAMLDEVSIVVLPPRAMSQPFSVRPGVEMVYVTISGDPVALLGKQLRSMPAGCGYKVVPDGTTPHANINQGDAPAVFLYLGGGQSAE